MVAIHADNHEIEKHVNRLIDLVEEGGGGMHSNLLITAREGNLAIGTKDPMDKGKELIRLTRNVLLPDDQYNIDVKGDEFTLDFPSDSLLTTLQKKLTETMVELYNATDKVRIHRDYSFMLSLSDYPEIIKSLTACRDLPEKYAGWADKAVQGLAGAELNKFIADTFLKTRHLGYSDHVRISSVSILMPVIDFLNHNWNGASFGVGSGPRAGDIVINNSQPVEGSAECYAFYGAMDSLDTLLRYDFIDRDAPVVRSVPLDFEMIDGTKYHVTGGFGGRLGKELSKKFADLRVYLPGFQEEDDHIKVSQLLIPYGSSEYALRRTLEYIVTQHYEKREDKPSQIDIAKWIAKTEQFVIAENLKRYEVMQSEIQGALDNAGDKQHFGLNNAKELVSLQLSKLQSYNLLEQAA